MTKYKQLTLDQRYVIYGLYQEGFTQRYIAGQLGVHPSTVNENFIAIALKAIIIPRPHIYLPSSVGENLVGRVY